jgi:hypothetical protein
MSKKWVQFQPRAAQLVSEDQINSEMQAARSSMASLDRTQMPAQAVTSTNLKTAALHQCYAVALTTPTGSRPGEQTNYNVANTRTDSWRCATYTKYNGGWQTLLSTTLTGHRGGNIYVEWGGIAMCLGIAHVTDDTTANVTRQEKFLGLRIRLAGQTVAERMGIPGSIENFRINGTIVLPSGDHELVLEWKGTGGGQSDPLRDTSSNALSQYHVFNNHYFAIGRFR